MNHGQAIRVLREAERRATLRDRLRASAFPTQRAFLDDPARMKAALCTRRAGKSYGIGLNLCDAALETPGSSQLYVALTRESAKRIMFKDVLKVINRQFGLGMSFNETTLEVAFPNGSRIYLLGIDAKPDEKDKILGQKFRRAVVDESASFRQDLEALCAKVIRPALADLRGDLSLVGTPGNLKGFFHDVTTGKVPGWSLHHWSAFDNPHMAAQWQEEVDELLATNPRVTETPAYRQMYLGEWTVDESMLVYRYSPAVNELTAVPELEGEVRYCMGVDLGYTDATAIVVCAYAEHDKTLYVVYAQKRSSLIVSQVADWIVNLRKRFPIDTMVVDNASKQAVEELRQRYRLPLESAEKQGKADAIAMLNSDLIMGNIKLVMPYTKALAAEWGGLVWDERALERTRKYVEHPSCENHLADSFLYAWRHASNYAATPSPYRPRSPVDAIERDEEKELEDMERAERGDWWEREV